jgi:transcriptional regulator with XRE-family HTH domain
VGANIRKARDKVGLTQESLAEAADLDVRFLQRLEHGRTNVSVENLVSLADALNVPIGELFKPAKLLPARPGRPPGRAAK